MNLDRFNAALCAGSCAVYRRSAVESFGGVAEISHSEDMFTGFEMTQRGRFKVWRPVDENRVESIYGFLRNTAVVFKVRSLMVSEGKCREYYACVFSFVLFLARFVFCGRRYVAPA